MKAALLARIVAKARSITPAPRRATVLHYVLSRASYDPPLTSTAAETVEILLSAGRAAAALVSTADEGDAFVRDTWAARLVATPRNEPLPVADMSRYVTGTLDEIAGFYRNAQLARENRFAGSSRKLPLEDLAIVEMWICAPRGGNRFLSLAECSASVAAAVLDRILNIEFDPKNWPRTKARLGLRSLAHPTIKAPARFA